MKKRLQRLAYCWLGAGAVVGASVKGGAQAAHAYNNLDNWPCKRAYTPNQGLQLTIYFKEAATTPSVHQAYQASVSDWNTSDTPTNYVAVSSNWDTYMYEYSDAADPAYGYTAAKDPNTFCNGGLHGFNVALNTYTVYRDWSNDQNFVRSVTGHEEGHVVGLGHSTVTPALLNQGRDRHSVYSPKNDDVCGVNAMYPSSYWPRSTQC